MVLEFASQKEKAVQLIPGADVKSFLGDGDDVIQTHTESGKLYKVNKRRQEKHAFVAFFVLLFQPLPRERTHFFVFRLLLVPI